MQKVSICFPASVAVSSHARIVVTPTSWVPNLVEWER